jgi:hypothetical protein
VEGGVSEEFQASHNDIYRRIEQVEVSVAVLNSQTGRLHSDFVEIREDVKEIGRIARRISYAVYIVPVMLGAVYTLINIIKASVA